MNILTVLDFNDGKVWQYDISTDKELQTEDFEKIMLEQGHDLDDCEWMSYSDDTLRVFILRGIHIKHIEYYEKH